MSTRAETFEGILGVYSGCLLLLLLLLLLLRVSTTTGGYYYEWLLLVFHVGPKLGPT